MNGVVKAELPLRTYTVIVRTPKGAAQVENVRTTTAVRAGRRGWYAAVHNRLGDVDEVTVYAVLDVTDPDEVVDVTPETS